MNGEQKTDFINQILEFAHQQGLDKDNQISLTALKHIEYYLSRHFSAEIDLKTLEFGCGSSTLLFSRYAHSHVVYDAGDDFKRRTQHLKSNQFGDKAKLKFINSNFQESMSVDHKNETYNIVLFNGNTAYPNPDVNYFYILPYLEHGSILIINNVNIPTINNLCNILKQDDMFYLHSTVQATAFFTRTSAPTFDYKKKSWPHQSYNAQQYVGDRWRAYDVGLPFPFDVTFDGRQNALNPWFQRGFSLFNGRPITDGWYSEIKLPFEKPVNGSVIVTLDFEAIVPSWRPESGILLDVNGSKAAEILFENTLRQQVAVVVDMAGEREIRLSLTHKDVRLAGHLGPLSGTGMPDCRQPNVVFHALSVQLPGAAKTAGQMRRADGSIISFDCRGQVFSFFVENPHDSIQAHHNVGSFYEVEELELLTRLVPSGAHILDIGANIGNHSVWFEKILGARSITPIEPQARMVALYRTNCQLNGLKTIDERYLGLALGDVNQSGDVRIEQNFNPAGARIEPSATGEIRIRIGDEVLAGDNFDFVKIDVEGAELNVLRGLKKLFARCRPLLFVEVWEENRAGFDELMVEFDYEVIDEYRRYDVATNLILRSRTINA